VRIRRLVGDGELVVRIRRLVADGGLVVRMAKSLDRAMTPFIAVGPTRRGASLATFRGSRADLANPSLDPRHNPFLFLFFPHPSTFKLANKHAQK